MAGCIYFKTVIKVVAIILLFAFILARFADAKGRARLSYNVAEAVCKSTAAFSRSNQIEPPSKASITNDKLCKTLTWSNCETSGVAKVTCQKFKLKDCPAQSQSKPQKSKERKVPRIVNGTEVKPHEFPHIVRITLNGTGHCGGAILNENYIVTAAHCFFEFWGKGINNTFNVIAGDHSTKVHESTEQIRTVVNVTWHPNHNFTAFHANDIAVVLLDTPLELSENVHPPEMPQSDYDAQGDLVTIAGWGMIKNGGIADLSDILLKADLTVGVCDPRYPVNTSNVICAVSDGESQGPCRGDSGGPLTKKLENGQYLLLGIFSITAGCLGTLPSVYNNVSRYIGWIKANIEIEDC